MSRQEIMDTLHHIMTYKIEPYMSVGGLRNQTSIDITRNTNTFEANKNINS